MNLSIKVLICILTVFFGFISNLHAQTPQDAIKALKKLEAKAEVGMSYQKYLDALGDANAEVKVFIDSPSGKQNPQLTKSLNKVIDHYKDATELWKCLNDYPERAKYFNPQEYAYGQPDLKHENFVTTKDKMFRKYPMAYENLKVYGREVEWHGRVSRITAKEISLDDFVRVIWNQASLELSKATKLLNQQ